MSNDLRKRLRDQWRNLTKLQAEFSRTIGEADARGDYKLDRHTSMRSWLVRELHMTGSEASQRVCVARQLRELPKVTALFTDGQLPYPHVSLLARTRVGIGATAFTEVQSDLLATAQALDAARFRQHVRQVRQEHTPVRRGTAADQSGHGRLAIRTHEDGTVTLHGRLDQSGGATLQEALNTVLPTPTGTAPTPKSERRAEALITLCSRQLSSLRQNTSRRIPSWSVARMRPRHSHRHLASTHRPASTSVSPPNHRQTHTAAARTSAVNVASSIPLPRQGHTPGRRTFPDGSLTPALSGIERRLDAITSSARAT
ncbi:DUF222 domain-containing protein [Crossiella cryophila]|uniref:DUF222 domain-containing protein n=1 Tax=Crossiella cryophila TaxID=43355 RepID=A0A7W7CJ44_9PSEU|nr:DUF222 domain-containing protein [Crossiella cryophila]MBB4681917.1 hypothetical protein [Crossiella cryophila]